MRAVLLLAISFAALHAAEPAVNTEGKTPMDFLSGKPVTVSAAQMQAHGFLPMEVHFDLTGTGMMGALFPAPDTLISLSGPPGGPSHFVIRLIRAKAGEPLPTLEALVKEEDEPGRQFTLGIASEIEIAGAKHRALSWSVQPTPWRDSNATVLIPLADARHAVLISFSASYDAKAKTITPGGFQQTILKSLTIEEKR